MNACRLALLGAAASLALVACSPKANAPKAPAAAVPAAEPAKPVAANVPAGEYSLDKAHSTVTFKVNHLGFSNYVARFRDFDAKLKLDPANPAASSIEVTIDPRSLDVPPPPAGFLDTLRGPQWLDAGKYPAITFRSTKVEPTGADTARVTGDFTLHGVTRPVTLDVKFNGGYAGHPMDPHARVGFSAHTTLNRSDFGMGFGVPAPGTTMGVSDAVDVAIETEFSGPPLAQGAVADAK